MPKRRLPRPRLGIPSVFFCLTILSALALQLPDNLVNKLSANSVDFVQHRWLIVALRLLSYQFMHAGADHFKYNFLIALAPCLYLENRLGSKRFLAFYLFAGMVAGLVFMQMISHSPVGMVFIKMGIPITILGASGSVYGCLALAAILWGLENVYNAALACLFVLYFVVGQVVAAINSLQTPSEIAYWGHVGGILAALLVVPLFLRKRGKRS
jgi:membrane associated rhomboid family serine protease